MKKLIPKKIHYFWFGNKPKPESVNKCIRSWKKYCPGYEIIEWNEDNYDINKIKFCRDAYNNKTWAYVVDAARLDVIYNYGGFYFDTDVEIVKNLDPLLGLDAFGGFESEQYVNPGCGFGATPKNKIIGEFLDKYNSISFNKYKNDLAKISIPVLVTEILEKKGLVRNGSRQVIDGMTLFPVEYFAPKDLFSRIINLTDNTYSIHHYDASWVDNKEKSIIADLDKKGTEMMKKFPTLVSIIIPVYNGENFMRKAIDSALAQTYKNIEVIVINDGSKDDTDKIAKEYGSRIRYINKQNGGVASAMNVGIANMRGKYFSWLSHDDTYYPEKIELLMRESRNIKEDTILVSDWTLIDENDVQIGHCRLDDVLEKNPRAFLAFDRKTWLNGCAMLIPVNLFQKYGNFNETLRTTQDYDLFFRFMEKGVKFKIYHRELIYSRAHANQGSLSDARALENSDKIHRYMISRLSVAEIDNYFLSNYSKFINVYDSFLSNGYSRSPAYLISRYIANSIDSQRYGVSERLIEDRLMSEGSEQIINDAQSIINCIQKKKSKKRLLFASGYWLTGGVERVLVNIFSKIHNNYEIFIITPFDGRTSKIDIPAYVTQIKISENLYSNHFDSVLLSYALLLKADVVIGNINLFEKQLDFYKICEDETIHTVAINHEFFFYPYEDPEYREVALKRLDVYKNIDAAIWLTNFNCSVYSQLNDNGYLIHNPNPFKINSMTNSNNKTIISIGRFNDRVKRVDRLLKCFKLVLNKIPEAKLVLVGPCDRNALAGYSGRTINELIKTLNISQDNIKFVGEVSNVGRYLSQATVLMITSESEGFPMVINEAASYAIPTVCNYIPGIEDIIIEGKNGYITEQDDIESMANNIYKIIMNKKLNHSLSKQSQLMVNRFSPDIIASKWKILFNTIISSKTKEDAKKVLLPKLGSKMGDNQLFCKYLVQETSRIIMHEKKNGEVFNGQADCQNCRRLYNSHSWQYTRPGRLAKDGLLYVKKFGLRFTIRKVILKVIAKVRQIQKV